MHLCPKVFFTVSFWIISFIDSRELYTLLEADQPSWVEYFVNSIITRTYRKRSNRCPLSNKRLSCNNATTLSSVLDTPSKRSLFNRRPHPQTDKGTVFRAQWSANPSRPQLYVVIPYSNSSNSRIVLIRWMGYNFSTILTWTKIFIS